MIRIRGTKNKLPALAKAHLSDLTNEKNSFISPKENLLNWINEGSLIGQQRTKVQEIYDEFDSIVLGDTEKLATHARTIGKVADKAFSDEIVCRMRYKQFRTSSRARRMLRALDLRACPYCNAQYVLAIGRNGKLLCHFDHVLPKRHYPYLCVSYFNLVPCCSYCNQMKSADDLLPDSSFHHPFKDSIADKFRFQATSRALSDFHAGGRTDSGNVNLKLVVKDGQDLKFHITTFRLEEVHNEHNDVIDEVYLRSQMYNNSRYEELKSEYVDNLGILTEEELTRIFFGGYMNKDEINKRPLTKLTQDLYYQFMKL